MIDRDDVICHISIFLSSSASSSSTLIALEKSPERKEFNYDGDDSMAVEMDKITATMTTATKNIQSTPSPSW